MAQSTKPFDDYLKKQLKNKTVKQAYEEESVYAALAVQIATAREKSHLSQKDLARRLHTSQQMVSRIEDPRNKSFSLRTLIKLAHALNKELRIELV
jgi:ribosome-binding protein aMBF1 (putative translation factor)